MGPGLGLVGSASKSTGEYFFFPLSTFMATLTRFRKHNHADVSVSAVRMPPPALPNA